MENSKGQTTTKKPLAQTQKMIERLQRLTQKKVTLSCGNICHCGCNVKKA